jgi:uncharacterized membrane protein YidH (DUF202 family)
MIKWSLAMLAWLIHLFNPPPLNSMTFGQKAGRVVLFTATLIVGSVLVAMLGALGLFVMERSREMGRKPEFFNGACIILAGIVVNVTCLTVLLHIKKADNKLVPPPKQ